MAGRRGPGGPRTVDRWVVDHPRGGADENGDAQLTTLDGRSVDAAVLQAASGRRAREP
ncbi:hypothetical protein GCM10017691_10730 [Pseudonocardia petroleophila]